jgi:succinyl-CoA synthetase alpha subunit
MGHAGAIISGGKGTAAEKMAAMKKAGIHVVESPAEIGITMKKALDKIKSKSATKPAPKKKVVKKPAKPAKKTVKKAVKKAAPKKKSVTKTKK